MRRGEVLRAGAPLPLPARLFNRLGAEAQRLVPPRFEVPALLRQAEAQAGLSGWGDRAFEERLGVILGDIEAAGDLTPIGALTLHQLTMRKLVNRLRHEELIRRHPEILDVPVERPVFVTGWFRSGTTLLHNLLAQARGTRAPRLHELWHPCPTEPTAVVRGRLRLGLEIARYLGPGLASVHPVEVDGPEECFLLLENDFVSLDAFMLFGAHDYASWQLGRDVTGAYRYLRRQLQAMSWRAPGRRWVLKSPFHLWNLDALLAAFPDACVVHLHRTIHESLPSLCSMSLFGRSMFLERVDPRALGRFWMDMCASAAERALAARRRAPPERFIDVRYRELVKDPLAALSTIAGRFGLVFGEQEIEAARRFLAANPQGKHGAHRYSLDQFHLDPAEVDGTFAGFERALLDARGAPSQPAS